VAKCSISLMTDLMRNGTVLAAMVCALGACALGTHGNSSSGTSHLFSTHAVVLDVPFEPQHAPGWCGLAALDMVSRYHSLPVLASQRKGILGQVTRTGGSSGSSLKEAFLQSGYFVAVFSGTFDSQPTSLLHHLDHGRPLIVMLAAKHGGSRHYVVVAGYDPMDRQLVILDPTKGRVTVPFEDFNLSWQKANRFTLLATPTTRSSERSSTDVTP